MLMKWQEMPGNAGKCREMPGNGRKWREMVGNGGKWWEVAGNGSKGGELKLKTLQFFLPVYNLQIAKQTFRVAPIH